jgi:hypothetical protein
MLRSFVFEGIETCHDITTMTEDIVKTIMCACGAKVPTEEVFKHANSCEMSKGFLVVCGCGERFSPGTWSYLDHHSTCSRTRDKVFTRTVDCDLE